MCVCVCVCARACACAYCVSIFCVPWGSAFLSGLCDYAVLKQFTVPYRIGLDAGVDKMV